MEVARDAGDGRSGGGDSDGCGTEAKGRITLTLELEDDAEPGHARWTVKNTLKDRKTSVVLATATLPKVDDVSSEDPVSFCFRFSFCVCSCLRAKGGGLGGLVLSMRVLYALPVNVGDFSSLG